MVRLFQSISGITLFTFILAASLISIESYILQLALTWYPGTMKAPPRYLPSHLLNNTPLLIHGLWAADDNGVAFPYGDKKPWNFGNFMCTINPSDAMKKYWLADRFMLQGMHVKNHVQWFDQWWKHGQQIRQICPKINTPQMYFNTTVDLYMKFGLPLMDNVRKTLGIFVNLTEVHRRATIQSAVETVLGVIPAVNCLHDPERDDQKSIFVKLILCFCTNLVIMDCPTISTCPSANIEFRQWTEDSNAEGGQYGYV